MDINGSLNETRMEANLSVVLVVTAFTGALILETILVGWEIFVIPFFIACVCIMWFCHLTEIVPPKIKIAFYIGIMMVESFFYGIHPTSLYDLPIITIITTQEFSRWWRSIFRFCFGIFSFSIQYRLKTPWTFRGSVSTFLRSF